MCCFTAPLGGGWRSCLGSALLFCWVNAELGCASNPTQLECPNMGNNLNWLGFVAAVIVAGVSWYAVMPRNVSLPLIGMAAVGLWASYHCLRSWK